MRRAALLCVALACWGGASLSAPAPAPVAPGPAQPAPPGGGAPAAAPAPGTGPAPAPAAAAAPLPRPPSDALFSPDDDDDPLPSEIDDDEDQDTNTTERGMYLGAPCEFTCNSKLHHVFCDPITGHCECEKKYPVRLGANKGCAKPKSLGEQCFYRQACKYMDAHASCIQINHNAICQCESGFHSVSYSKPVRKVFCTEDMALLTSDVHTLLGVCSGIAILAGLLCLVLHLYTRGRLPHNVQAGHYADASLSPPMLFSSETGDKLSGIPLCVQDMQGQGQCGGPYQGPGHGPGRTGSRSSLRSAGRRASPSPLGAPSRAGSRRPSLTSLQSSSSSVRSFSMRRFEREREQKERRQQMQMRLAQLQGGVGLGALSGGEGGPSGGRGAPSPSPRTPNSTDGLLPAVNETRELSLSQFPLMDECESPSMDGIIGPCSSSGTSY